MGHNIVCLSCSEGNDDLPERKAVHHSVGRLMLMVVTQMVISYAMDIVL